MWLAALATAAVTLAIIAAVVAYLELPSVAGAPARVRAIDARFGAGPVPVARDAKVARAIVAVEDERFYDHGAVDPEAVARALASSLTSSSDPGGSTIAQQLAKVLYVSNPETIRGRLRAIGLAVKLERRFSKAQILAMYLNAIYFGHGYYGVSAASHGYFGKPVDRLSWGEAALLAGLPQSPSAFDPRRHPARAKVRRGQVLAQLASNGVLTANAAHRLAAAPLQLHPD